MKKFTETLRSFPAGSAGGRDGFLPRHLLSLLKCPVEDIRKNFLFQLASFTNKILAGSLPLEFAPHFTCANMIPLRKPDSDDPRPR